MGIFNIEICARVICVGAAKDQQVISTTQCADIGSTLLYLGNNRATFSKREGGGAQREGVEERK